MVLIAVLPEMVTEVGAPLPVNVAVLSGTVGLELQLVPVVHSAPGPVHVPSTACAPSGASMANAPSHAPPSSAARVAAARAAGAAARMARTATEAAGADRRARADCNRSERITPQPLARSTAANAAVPFVLPPPRIDEIPTLRMRAGAINSRVPRRCRLLAGCDFAATRGRRCDLGVGTLTTTERDHEYVMNILLTSFRVLG